MSRRENKLPKSWIGIRNGQVAVLLIFLALIFVAIILYSRHNIEKPSSSYGPMKLKWNSFESLVKFDPTVEFMNGTDVIWQTPDSPKAVLFLAHGCNNKAVNFWDRSPKCLKCVGMPEDRLLVLHALTRNFAVITVSSRGRCWSFGKERLLVKGIINWWVEKHKLEKLPLVALGASSGGNFVSVLATDLRFNSITIMIAEGFFDQMDVTKDYPPTLFVHMPKDETRKQKIDENMRILKDKDIDTAEIKCMEFPLSHNFLAYRIPGLDHSISVKLFNLLQDKGFIDKNGYMMKDGRATPWKAALKQSKIHLANKSLVNHIQEELNLAFSYHEMTSLQSDQIFEWFESHMS
ncbi:unnamed protein product [Ilex paraguariensis]|uniref:Uncharacterized protein n=1 Tax=Ilex paraguariensis TaxID=185542 RepID=A0ABC8UBX3_9AQUA